VSQPTATPRPSRKPGWDALALAVLVFALMQISGLAEATLSERVADVIRHPLLGNLLPAAGIAAMGEVGPRPGEPIGLVLNAISLGLLLAYLLVDLGTTGQRHVRLKWLLLSALLITMLFLPTLKLILLRQQSGPASYSHDGGVIQTEVTIRFLFEGKNPYREEYTDTPMAEWGFSEYRTALYHYPYLPWTFLFSAPFAWLAERIAFYDQRMVYLLLIAVALALAPRLAILPRSRLALVAILGLNPLMALDIIFGQNDVFIFAWLLYSLVALRHWRAHRQPGALWLSAILFGLACASKPTAWFFAPFYGLLLLDAEELGVQPGVPPGWAHLVRAIPLAIRRAGPALAVVALIVGPYVVWDAYAIYDDVWRWSAGQGETGYQIWGWGASNFVLALGLVQDRFAQWPFWILEIVVALPLLLWLMRRQLNDNSIAGACWRYGVFLFAFFYVSRFLNENYLAYILAFLAIGWCAEEDVPQKP
jgi:hypothetical protein